MIIIIFIIIIIVCWLVQLIYIFSALLLLIVFIPFCFIDNDILLIDLDFWFFNYLAINLYYFIK